MKQIGEYKELEGKGLPIKELIGKKPIAHKQEILKFMKQTPAPSIMFMWAKDPITNKVLDHLPDVYETPDGKYTWRYESMYCFEKYNLKLPEEFIAYALEHIK